MHILYEAKEVDKTENLCILFNTPGKSFLGGGITSLPFLHTSSGPISPEQMSLGASMCEWYTQVRQLASSGVGAYSSLTGQT